MVIWDKNKYLTYLNLDVLDKDTLTKYGYTANKYYCGNKKMEVFWTKLVKDYLEKNHRFAPIYNRACFKHDLIYSLELTPRRKRKADKTFIYDMRQLFLEHIQNSPKINMWQAWKLWMRFNLYFLVVRACTPFYYFRRNKDE